MDMLRELAERENQREEDFTEDDDFLCEIERQPEACNLEECESCQ